MTTIADQSPAESDRDAIPPVKLTEAGLSIFINSDLLIRACNSFGATLAAMKQGRSALAVLAQSDPTYEPAWRALTDAIKLAEGPMRPTAPEGTCEQPSEGEKAEFDRLNVPERHEGD